MTDQNKLPVIEPESDLEETAKIPVYMPDAEVKQFLAFQQYFRPISVLIEAKVFEEKNSTVLLDFDHLGTLVKVRRNDVLWRIN